MKGLVQILATSAVIVEEQAKLFNKTVNNAVLIQKSFQSANCSLQQAGSTVIMVKLKSLLAKLPKAQCLVRIFVKRANFYIVELKQFLSFPTVHCWIQQL